MKCIKGNNDAPCCNCKVDIMSADFLIDNDIITLLRLMNNIVWSSEFNYSNITTCKVNSFKIKCNGEIVIKVPSNNNIDILVAKAIYSKVVRNWYTIHKHFKEKDSYTYVASSIDSIAKVSSITKLRTITLDVANYITRINTCTSECRDIISEKEVSYCKISLTDLNRFSSFSYLGILETITSIAYSVKERANFNVFIDMDTSYITCNGEIYTTTNYITCSSTISTLKDVSKYYLRLWSSRNVHRITDIERVKKFISFIDQSRSVSEICNMCNVLINE
jgi:hypothetical protein